MPRRSVLTVASGLLLVGLLWSVGRFVAVPPAAMGALLLATLLHGVLALAISRRGRRRSPFPARLSAFVSWGAAAAFLAQIFLAIPDVETTRRVAKPSADVTALRLINFNVLHGYPSFRGQEERYARLHAALRALDPTVIVLQEAWWITGYGQLVKRLAADLGLDAAYSRANGSRHLIGFEEGCAVLSRLPVTAARRLVLRPRWPPWERRIALDVELYTGPGSALRIVGVHLAAGRPKIAAAQARDLLRFLAARPFLVVGDFNAPSASPTLRTFTEQGYEDVVPGGIDHVLMRPNPSWRLVSAGWTLREPDLDGLIGESAAISDHPGILVELERMPSPVGQRFKARAN